jgi:TRAP-type C4-dicarboxylate transport system permease small subunit
MDEPIDMRASRGRSANPLTRINWVIARTCTIIAMTGLLSIVAIVFYTVIGRYVFNATPTWAETLALVLILYVTLIGAAVGVRDAGHIGMESILVMVSGRLRTGLELLIHALVLIFGFYMAYNGWVLGSSVMHYKLANLNLPEIVRYVPLMLSGVLVVLFSIEHIIALCLGETVEPTWS